MAKLTTKARMELPANKFAGPGRSFPIENKIHAEKALQLAPKSVAAGNITPAQNGRSRGARVQRDRLTHEI